jgi:hypothetical protein
MPCALWEPCGCNPGRIGALDLYHDDYYNEIENQEWSCSTSPTGAHRYIEGEPHKPVARCGAEECDEAVNHTAFELGLPAGVYLVRPWWDGDTVQLELIDPLVVTQ